MPGADLDYVGEETLERKPEWCGGGTGYTLVEKMDLSSTCYKLVEYLDPDVAGLRHRQVCHEHDLPHSTPLAEQRPMKSHTPFFPRYFQRASDTIPLQPNNHPLVFKADKPCSTSKLGSRVMKKKEERTSREITQTSPFSLLHASLKNITRPQPCPLPDQYTFDAYHTVELAGFVASDIRGLRDQICTTRGPEGNYVRHVDF